MYSLLRASERPKRIRVTRDTFQETKASTAFLHPDGNILRWGGWGGGRAESFRVACDAVGGARGAFQETKASTAFLHPDGNILGWD
jgi:hypothetical protein